MSAAEIVFFVIFNFGMAFFYARQHKKNVMPLKLTDKEKYRIYALTDLVILLFVIIFISLSLVAINEHRAEVYKKEEESQKTWRL